MNIEQVYYSVITFASGIVPSGVSVVEGESYGVRFTDPKGKSPSVTVTIDDIYESYKELGTPSTNYSIVLTINAPSRRQRDALKSIVYSGCMFNQISIYSSFDSPGVPASGASIVTEGEFESPITIRDMPDFNSGRERFFWTAVAFGTLAVLGS